jgi:integrase
MSQRGQLIRLKRTNGDGEPLWAYRFRLGGRGSKRVQRGGFVSERDAAEALEREFERLRRERRLARSLTFAELVETYLAQHDVEPVTIEKLRWLLGRMDRTRMARHRPERARRLRSPFVHEGPLEVPEDRDEPASGAAADDRARSARTSTMEPAQGTCVPGRAGRLPRPAQIRNREWKPAQLAAGIAPLRRIYDLRHTFATFALRTGISTFDLSRYMGASLTMIDRHYGHLARDGREHAIRLLDELNPEQRPRWTLVDAAWTPKPAASATADNRNTS